MLITFLQNAEKCNVLKTEFISNYPIQENAFWTSVHHVINAEVVVIKVKLWKPADEL